MSEDEARCVVRITLDTEVERLLRENEVDLRAMLANDPAVSGQFRTVASSECPLPRSTSQSRMEPLTIAASAVVIVALGSSLERIIKVLTRRPVVLTNERYEPVLDADGRPIIGPDGNTVVSKVTTQTLEESKDANAPSWETYVSASEFRIALGEAAK